MVKDVKDKKEQARAAQREAAREKALRAHLGELSARGEREAEKRTAAIKKEKSESQTETGE